MSEGIDLGRVKRNVAKMVAANAPENEIDAYIAGEGTSIDAVRAFHAQAGVAPAITQGEEPVVPTSRSSGFDGALSGPFAKRLYDEKPVEKALVGGGAGLVQAGIGALQAANEASGDALDIRDAAKAAVEETRTIQGKQGAIGQAAGLVGEYGPYAAIPAAGGSMLGRAALGAVSGAAQGAASAEGAEEVDRKLEAAKGAITGAVIVPAVELGVKGTRAAARGLGSLAADAAVGMAARGDDALAATSSALKQRGQQAYQAARDAGAVIKADKVAQIAGRLEKALADTGKNNARLHGDTLAVLDDIKAAATNDLSLEEADQFRQLLREVVNKNTDKLNGANADAMKAAKLMEALDDAVESIGRSDLSVGSESSLKLWQEARKQWADWRRFDAVGQIVQRAEGDPGKLRSGFKRFVDNPKNLRGMKASEVDALKRAATSSTSEKLAQALGRFGFDTNNVFIPGLTTVVGGAPVAAAGTLARQVSKYASRGKAEKVLRAVEAAR